MGTNSQFDSPQDHNVSHSDSSRCIGDTGDPPSKVEFTNRVLREVIEASARSTGEDLFRSLVKHLARSLGFRHAMIGRLVGEGDRRIRTLAIWGDGKPVENLEYDLRGTPCEQVSRGETCYHLRDVQRKFPEDELLVQMEAECYIGVALRDTMSRALGVLAVLDDRPAQNAPEIRAALTVFAERAATELERMAADEATLASERKYRALVETSPYGIIRIDSAGGFLSVNSAGMTIFGRTDEHPVIGTRFLETVAEEDRRKVGEELRSASQGAAREFEYLAINGKALQASLVPLGDSEAHVETIIGIVMDVSERRKVEAEREALIAELEAKNAELQQFTDSVSHDLKGPLVTISGFLGHLAKDVSEGDQERIRDDIRWISDATQRMKQMLDELLELSRAGSVISSREPVDLGPLVHDLANMVKSGDDSESLEVVVADDLPVVLGDRGRLRQVVQNLLLNAVKFRRVNLPCRVEVGARSNSGGWEVWVRDNGVGIAPEHHERVFRLFEKLDSDRSGTGMGLAIVKRILETHGGRVWVESEGRDQGSTFWFTWPSANQEKGAGS